MSEKLPIYRGYRTKKGVYDKRKGFFVEFPASKRFILMRETEKAYLVRPSNLRGIFPTDFSITSMWIPKWALKLVVRVGWSDTASHRKTYDGLQLLESIYTGKELRKKLKGVA